jgi:glucokinase
VIRETITAVRQLQGATDFTAMAIGVGIAGQIDPHSGVVRFAPNLGWREVPLQAELSTSLSLPTIVTNDVRAATWSEWTYGAGQGAADVLCLFIGTGIGGGVVSGGRLLLGASNIAGELGHVTVDYDGPLCHCGNRGCLEALAGGWAIARDAQEAVAVEPAAGMALLAAAGGDPQSLTARIVAQVACQGDPLARRLVERVGQVLAAGSVGLANALNPSRLILGGGVIDGLPELLDVVRRGILTHALPSARQNLQVLPAKLQKDAVAIGAAVLAMRSRSSVGQSAG